MKVTQMFIAAVSLPAFVVLGAWLLFGAHSANVVATKIGYLAVALSATVVVIWFASKCMRDAMNHYSDDEETP